MAIFKTKGIILSSKLMFENDKRVELFSKDLGKCTLLAKFAGNSKKRFGGRLEPTNYVQFVLRSGKSFYYIEQCDIIDSFISIRTDLNKIYLASFLFDIIRKVTVSHQHNDPLFNLLHSSLVKLNKGDCLIDIKTYFYVNFLITEGLLSSADTQTISDHHFKVYFEDYTGKRLIIPDALKRTTPQNTKIKPLSQLDEEKEALIH